MSASWNDKRVLVTGGRGLTSTPTREFLYVDDAAEGFCWPPS